jgi:1-acyl-sn-glycerol-3-phosphate acyltransferase
MESIRDQIRSARLGEEYLSLLGAAAKTRWSKKAFELYCRLFLFKLYCPVTVRGREHLPDQSFLFCSNHNSHMDSVALMIASGRPFERFGMMAAMDYFFENKTRKVFLSSLMNLIPITRQPSMKELVEAIVACRHFTRDQNRSVIIFPEGTRAPGRLLPFKKGPAMIAIELALPIVPAYISGTEYAMPKGRGVMRPHKVHVEIGEALYPADYTAGSSNGRFNRNYRYMTRELESRVRQLLEVAGCEN